MKTCKKILCVLLSIIMACSCLSIVSFAEGESFSYSMKYDAEKSTKVNATAILDKVDEMLKELNIYEEIEISSTKITIDLTSVDKVCETIDLIKTVWKTINDFLGDLKEMNFEIWEKGMSRAKTGDEKILYTLVNFLTSEEMAFLRKMNNPQVIGSLLDGDVSLGVVDNFISINELLGEDGVSGIIKKALTDSICNTEEEKNAMYAKYKNDIDAFIYDELINKLFADSFLPGFKVDANTNIEDILINAFNIAFDKYLKDIIHNDLHANLADNGADGAALAPHVNLDGSTYNLDGLILDQNKPWLEQINNLIGALAQQMIPGYDWVESTDYTKITANLEGVMKHLGKASGLIPDADSLSFNEISMKFIEILLRNLDLGEYNFIKECKTLEDMATAALIKLSSELETGITYGEDADYLVIIGDIFAWWFYDCFNIKDNNGNPYRAGGGKDCFEVANYFFNYFLFDKGGAGALGLSVKKTDSVFTKVDKLLDYFGKDKATGVSFDSKKFMLGDGSKKGLLDAIFTLDLQAILDLTVVPAINTAGDVSLVEFIYKTVYNMLKNWAGAELLPAYRQKAFTNALKNENLAKLVTNLLLSVGKKKDSILKLTYFICGFVFSSRPEPLKITEISAKTAYATGNNVIPEVTVKSEKGTLTYNKDYVVKADAVAPGTYTARVEGIGLYKGSFNVSFDVKMKAVGNISYFSEAQTIKLQWNAVPFADSYNVYKLNGETFELLENVTVPEGKNAAEYYITGLAQATEYTFKVEAVSSVYGVAEGKEISVATKPQAVDPATFKSKVSDSAVRFVWTAIDSADGYIVEQYIGSNKWKQVGDITKADITVSGLTSYTNYAFRVYAYKKTADGNVIKSDPATFNVRTKLGAITTVKTSATSTTITLQWNKVANAAGYQILEYVKNSKTGKYEWKSIAVLNNSTTSYKITGLKALTKHTYAVRAYVKESKYIFGAYKQVSLYTGFAKPANFKVTATNATAAALSWSAVKSAGGYELFQYKSGKWVSLGVTTKTTATIKNLPSGTKNYFRVRAVLKHNGVWILGDATGSVTALTLPGKVTGIKATDRKKTSITLQWNKVTGASGYQVFRYYNGKWVSLGMTTKNYWTDTKSLTRNTEYQYRVRAVQVVGKTYKYGAASATYKVKTTVL